MTTINQPERNLTMTTTHERCACGDCNWTGTTADTNIIADLAERLDAGAEVPVGECPECGSLAYLTHNPKAIILIGNVVDGLTIAGPFDSIAWACLWAEQNVPDHCQWNAVSLTTPTAYVES